MVIGLSAVTSDGLGVDNSRAANNAQEKEKELVIITWRDIISCSGWERADDIAGPELISVGWLVSENDDTIKIASTLDPTDSIGEAKGEALPIPYGITAFPKGCVVEVKYLP